MPHRRAHHRDAEYAEEAQSLFPKGVNKSGLVEEFLLSDPRTHIIRSTRYRPPPASDKLSGPVAQPRVLEGESLWKSFKLVL